MTTTIPAPSVPAPTELEPRRDGVAAARLSGPSWPLRVLGVALAVVLAVGVVLVGVGLGGAADGPSAAIEDAPVRAAASIGAPAAAMSAASLQGVGAPLRSVRQPASNVISRVAAATPTPSAPTPSPSSRSTPGAAGASCRGLDCPSPPGQDPAAGAGAGGTIPGGADPSSCAAWDLSGCVSAAIDQFLHGLVTDLLDPGLALLSQTLLTTPTPQQIPGLAGLWNSSWQILVGSYAVLVLLGAVMVMGYQSVQTRYGLREIAPRMIAGFLAGALSLLGSGIAIQLANALSAAVLADGVDPVDGATALRQLIGNSLTTAAPGGVPGTGLLIVGLVAAAILQMLLLVYVVRVAITVILIAAAPLVLMLHALPQTDGIARWWWRAFAGCLAVQVAQSLTLVATVKVFLTPDGVAGGLFGSVPGSDWARTLVVLALLILLWRIPFWILRAVRGGGSGRSLIGSIVRTAILIKTAGLIGGRSGGLATLLGGGRPRRPGFPPGPTGPGPRGPRPRPGPGPTPGRPAGGGVGAGGVGGGRVGDGGDPYAQARATTEGQLMLPLGVRRQPRPPAPPAHRPRPTAAGPVSAGSGVRGRQLALPLAEGLWPEHRPILGPDGQYRLPLDVTRTPRPTPPPPPGRALARPTDCGGGTAAGAAAGPLPRQPAAALGPVPAALRRPRPPPPTPPPHPATRPRIRPGSRAAAGPATPSAPDPTDPHDPTSQDPATAHHPATTRGDTAPDTADTSPAATALAARSLLTTTRKDPRHDHTRTDPRRRRPGRPTAR